MASLYKKKNSPFWYVQFINKDGKRVNLSTHCRHNNPLETKKAREYRAQIEIKELGRLSTAASEHWEHWVADFFKRHCRSPKTLIRYMGAWQAISHFLTEKGIHCARHVTYKHAIEYMEWRKKPIHRRAIGHNTAILHIKILSMLLNEAIKLGYCEANPLLKIGIAREKAKQKPPMTDEEIFKIREALKSEPKWMSIAFEIALYTGCRLGETEIPTKCIDLKRNTITFPHPKGGEHRAFSIPIPKALKRMLSKIVKSEQKKTLEVPRRNHGVWTKFFRKIGLRHLCFHCTRVTHITRLVPANVPEAIACRMVNHASALVHKIYQMLYVDDLRPYVNAPLIPSASTKQSHHKR